MATLVDQRPVDGGAIWRLWEEDGRLWTEYFDPYQQARMDWRRECRKANPAIRRDQEALYGVGYLEPFEREELIQMYPALGDKDPEVSHRAWREFWQSSRSEPYRTVDRV